MAEASVRRLYNKIRGSLWARPWALMALGMIVGVVLPVVDQTWSVVQDLKFEGWVQLFLSGTPTGSREVLTAAIAALATILAVGFSLMMVTVQLASSQYTARLLRTFMGDRVTQWVLGSFLATISYLLLVLRTIRADDDPSQGFVPLLSFLLGMVLTLICLSLLAYFLHHTTRSVDASAIIARVGRQTLDHLKKMDFDGTRTADEPALEPHVKAGHIHCERTGYVQLINLPRLIRALPEGTKLARIEVRTGDFVVPGTPVVSYWPDVPLPEKAGKHLDRAIAIGSERTLQEDVLYGVRKLVDMALKALSPGINDVTTALMVVNELGALIGLVACRAVPGRNLRVTTERGIPILSGSFGLTELIDEAYSELPRAARDHPRVLSRMLETLAQAARQTGHPESLRLLERSGGMIVEAVVGTQILPHERATLEDRWLALKAALANAPQEQHHVQSVH